MARIECHFAERVVFPSTQIAISMPAPVRMTLHPNNGFVPHATGRGRGTNNSATNIGSFLKLPSRQATIDLTLLECDQAVLLKTNPSRLGPASAIGSMALRNHEPTDVPDGRSGIKAQLAMRRVDFRASLAQ